MLLQPYKKLLDLGEDLDGLFSLSRVNDRLGVLVDVFETDSGYELEFDLPGLKKEDVQVHVQDNVLTVEGHRKMREEKVENGYKRIEKRYGQFARSFSLNDQIDSEKISADYKDGVLKVKLEKKPEVKPKRIDVKLAS